jgi:chromate transporter
MTDKAPPSLKEASKFWLKLGCISFGGPAGQISLMHQELVEKRQWLSPGRFQQALNYCMVLPGPEAQQLATYLGWLLHKNKGGIIAGTLFVLPSLILIMLLAGLYLKFGNVPVVAGLLYGIKPAIVAIIAHAAYRMAKRSLPNQFLKSLAAAALVATAFLEVPFPVILLSAALLGFWLSKRHPELLGASATHASISAPQPYYVIDDHYQAPHLDWQKSRMLQVLVIGLLLWLIPLLTLTLLFSFQHDFSQMAWFFSKAALLTFGGAYAVLPYVYHGAVGQYGWLSPGQMLDGLALGESTPGPLIMIVSFVGFLGAYQQALFGSDQLLFAGIVGALIATWFTFLPSFIFILGGAPWIESTRQQPHWQGPLTAISAAIVGVIINLALFFAMHIIWPSKSWLQPDYIALVIGLVAAFLLFYKETSLLKTLGVCALLGILSHYKILLA